MSSRFYTNQEKTLTEIINGILPKSATADILVGYFYFSGFKALSDGLVDKKVRVLVGMDVDITISKTVREVEYFKQNTQSRREVKEDYFQNLIRLFNETDTFDSEPKQEQFALFLKKIKEGTLEIRKTMDPCHAKMYIFSYNEACSEDGEEPGTVITGSSNLSYQGLEGRMEINARFTEKTAYNEAKAIFDKLWESSVVIVDPNSIPEWEEKFIKHTWYDKVFSPYLMYIRVLHEYFTMPTKENLLTPFDITDGKFHNLRYQTDAVQMALNSLDNHNGAIIADVVGLGKSIIASTVARNLHLRTIVICPPHLTRQWEEYRDEFGFTASVFSSGMIESALKHYVNIAKRDEQFLIIIDEAHRFRNEYTEDYANLHNLCSGNKVLLLTATPFNNTPSDIYSLVKLFQIPTHSTLKTVENLGATFKELIDAYQELNDAKRKGTSSEEDVKVQIASISKTIRTIISPLVIRRSRIDLQQIGEYKKDLENQRVQLVIPDDPEELTYDLSELRELYLSTLDRISASDGVGKDGKARFKAARYSPLNYLKPETAKQFAEELEAKTGIRYGMLMGRQSNVASFMRHLLVARFESSVAAFKASLGYMIKSYEHMLEWIDKRNKIPVYKKGNLPSVDDFYESTDDGLSEVENAFEKYESRGFFEIDMKYINEDFMPDIAADLSLLKGLRAQWFGTDNIVKEDPKLNSFIEILREKLSNEPSRKIVIFTEYADTANYLGEALKQAGLPVMKYTSADASVSSKETIRLNFDAGLKSSQWRNDFKVLVATDAISEGFNLHRAGAIVNYDIPYNPTRVIQRIGRINRINKKMFEHLHIYNYFPTDVGEKETRVKDISTLKMAMIHAIMGEDTKALTSDEQIQAFFKDRFRAELAKSEQESWDTPYRRLLNESKGTEVFEKALALPHRARTARMVDKPNKGVLVFGKKGNDYVFKIGNDTGEVAMLAAEDAFALFSAEQSEEAVGLSDNFDTTYSAVKASLFKNEATERNEREILNALQKVKLFLKLRLLSQDYLEDLLTCLRSDALSGYEIRFINQLIPEKKDSLIKVISPEYLARQIAAQNWKQEREELLILTEELQ